MTHIENCQETLKTLGKDLFVKGFDLHSVWNQISVFNKDFAAALAKGQEQLAQDEEYESDHSEIIQDDLESVSERLSGDASEEIGDLSGSDYSEIDQDMDEDDTFEQDPQKTKRKRTEVDDDFFSVRAMEEFAEMGERQDIKMSKMQAPESDAEESDNDIFSFGKGLANGEFDEEDNANGTIMLTGRCSV